MDETFCAVNCCPRRRKSQHIRFLPLCVSFFRTISQKIDAARITKLDIEMFEDESCKSIYLGSRGQGHELQNITLLPAWFFAPL